jgi:N-acetylmuramoyl-L-alanine amidase
MSKKIKQLFFGGLILATMSCSTVPYGQTNKFYKKQTKELSKTIRSRPVNPTGQDFVGTTNFGLRKPNYVIIHHTAQNSTEQTLKDKLLSSTKDILLITLFNDVEGIRDE